MRKLFRRHLRIDMKNYLKKKFKKPLHLTHSEAFECVRFVDAESELHKTNIFYLYQPYYLMKNIRSVLYKDPELIEN